MFFVLFELISELWKPTKGLAMHRIRYGAIYALKMNGAVRVPEICIFVSLML